LRAIMDFERRIEKLRKHEISEEEETFLMVRGEQIAFLETRVRPLLEKVRETADLGDCVVITNYEEEKEPLPGLTPTISLRWENQLENGSFSRHKIEVNVSTPIATEGMWMPGEISINGFRIQCDDLNPQGDSGVIKSWERRSSFLINEGDWGPLLEDALIRELSKGGITTHSVLSTEEEAEKRRQQEELRTKIMSEHEGGELERAVEDYKRRKQEERGLTEQERAAKRIAEQERVDKVDADFERVVVPVLKKFWSESAPQELINLFDEYARGVQLRSRVALALERRLSLGMSGGEILYRENWSGWPGSDGPSEKERVLQVLNEGGWKNLEICIEYFPDEEMIHPRSGKQILFGFSVRSGTSSIGWWTGGGDKKIEGEYTRTPESLKRTTDALAEALEEHGYYYYSFPTHGDSGMSGLSGSD